MTTLQKLLEFLNQSQVGYTHHVHPTVYTAREVASAEHVSPHKVAKTVICFSDNGYGMAVLPADAMVDLQELRLLLHLTRLRLATESEISELLPECELGAMPPFGNLFGLPVFVDSSLAAEEMIAFNAGTHRDVVHMRFRDYERLVKPTILLHRRAHSPWPVTRGIFLPQATSHMPQASLLQTFLAPWASLHKEPDR